METVIRVVLIYFMILIGFRLLGKREFRDLSPIELITLLLVPELVSQGVLREDFSLTNAIIAVTTLFSLVFITSLLGHMDRRVGRLISGEPCILISEGQFVKKHLNQERISPEELFSEMHKAGLYRLDHVKWAILETDGHIAFIENEER